MIESRVERSLLAYARTMFAQRTWSMVAARKAFPQVADIVYAVVSVGISSTACVC